MPGWLPLSLLVLALAAASHAYAQQVERIEIVEWGLFRHDVQAQMDSPESPSGAKKLVDNVRLQQATTTVPALVGMKFGIRFKIVGSPPGTPVVLKVVFRFPSQGLTNPAKGKTYSDYESHSNAVVGEVTYRGYGLDYDWEVETGPWTLEVWHQGRKLAEKTFMVTRLVSSVE